MKNYKSYTYNDRYKSNINYNENKHNYYNKSNFKNNKNNKFYKNNYNKNNYNKNNYNKNNYNFESRSNFKNNKFNNYNKNANFKNKNNEFYKNNYNKDFSRNRSNSNYTNNFNNYKFNKKEDNKLDNFKSRNSFKYKNTNNSYNSYNKDNFGSKPRAKPKFKTGNTHKKFKKTIKNNFKSKNSIEKKNKFNNKNKKRRGFIYRIDYADPQRKRAKTSLSRELFLVKTKLLKFYNNIKKDQIRRYANTRTFKLKFKIARGYTNKALLKYNSTNSLKKRLALNAFFSLVEHRLDVLLFRSNLVSTMLQARQLINHRHIKVNDNTVTHVGFMLKNFDVISLSYGASKRMQLKLLSNLKKKQVTLYPPKYVYADYRLMRACLLTNPVVKQIPFPFKIDLRKWLGLAKYMF